ncbi:hypothetical protein [Rhodohalobacter sp. 8-1]|uniref:hypothetical protein n=1 Tax=Rhodohalobacter sp. 8-1 TaxID=3131972 RepID=UPI0030EE38F6
MALAPSKDLIENINNLVHQETQLQEHCLDLTISEIYEFSNAGSLDFGGEEFEAASTSKLDPVKKDSDDSYGWWNLAGGTYLAITNESFNPMDNHSVFITPHQHAREAGLMVNTVIAERVESEPGIRIPIRVPEIGCKIKENARFASAYIVSG